MQQCMLAPQPDFLPCVFAEETEIFTTEIKQGKDLEKHNSRLNVKRKTIVSLKKYFRQENGKNRITNVNRSHQTGREF